MPLQRACIPRISARTCRYGPLSITMTYDNLINCDKPILDSPPVRPVEIYFEQLRGEILSILDRDRTVQETIRRLEGELNVYKRAYADLDAERERFQNLKRESDKQREGLEQQLKGHRIVVLVDGDGAIFNTKLIAQGQAGGHAAAQKLSDSITQHLMTTYGVNHYQLWVYVFLGKRGLADAFGRAGLMAAKAKFDDFIMGFNQAAERFIMLDVGGAKEAADTKIKAFLEDDIRLPQTEKIIFAGCHDNGYVTSLRSQITAGFKQKLILLRGYADMAAGINELELPSFSIPDLFIPQKLTSVSMPAVTQITVQSNQTPMGSPKVASLTAGEDLCQKNTNASVQQGFDALPFATVDGLEMSPRINIRQPAPMSYSSAVQTSPKRPETPELDSSGSTASSDGSEDSIPIRPSLSNARTRRVNPNIALSKHKPPPCTLFYLSNCKHGAECKYAHDYILEPEHFQEIRSNAKKSPCPSKNKGEVCLWGDDCCYGHYCPLTTKCHFLKQKRCKFVGGDMHKEQK